MSGVLFGASGSLDCGLLGRGRTGAAGRAASQEWDDHALGGRYSERRGAREPSFPLRDEPIQARRPRNATLSPPPSTLCSLTRPQEHCVSRCRSHRPSLLRPCKVNGLSTSDAPALARALGASADLRPRDTRVHKTTCSHRPLYLLGNFQRPTPRCHVLESVYSI